jgi:hypothetical protein
LTEESQNPASRKNHIVEVETHTSENERSGKKLGQVTKDVDIDGDFSVHNVPKMRFGLLRCKSEILT